MRMGGGGWKRVALDSKKKRFWKKKGFWLAEISSFQVQLEKFSAKGNVFAEKGWLLRIARQGLCKRKLLVVKKTAFECII